MGLILAYQPGQTPLDEDEREGLLLESITTVRELDEHEQLNIEKAMEWTIGRRFKVDQILTESFIKKLHYKMLGDVWSWAGKFRKSEKNIGVEWIHIVVELKKLLDDAKFWIEHQIYPPDELTLRLMHRLVSIHCFPNGNGRHSRIMADIMIESVFNREVFSWHALTMTKPEEVRKKYIASLRDADKGNIKPLIEFARS